MSFVLVVWRESSRDYRANIEGVGGCEIEGIGVQWGDILSTKF